MTGFCRKFLSLSFLNVFIWSWDASEFDSSNWTMFADPGTTLFSSLKFVVLVFLRMLCSGVTVPETLVEESGCPLN